MKAFSKIHAILAAAALLAAAASAGAQPAPGPGFGSHRPPMERMLGSEGAHGSWWNNPKVVDRLKLTDDQRKAMDQILLQHRETLIDMHANVQKAELAMEPLMSADQPNESAILAQIDKVAQARAELEKANARFLLELRGKLNPDQWKDLQAMRSERRQGAAPGPDGRSQWRNHNGRGNRQGPPPGSPDANPQGAPPPSGAPGGPQSFLDQPPAPGPDRNLIDVPAPGTVE